MWALIRDGKLHKDTDPDTIGYNGIGRDAGAQAIAKHLTGLTELDIGYNGIGDAGARAIAERLTGLTTLNIGGSGIGDTDTIISLIRRLLPKEQGGTPGGALRTIQISDNPLKTPRGTTIELPAVLEKTPAEAVLDYLIQIIKGEEAGTNIRVPEARLVLAGAWFNGKSQLARALSGKLKPGDKINKDDRTIGVDVETLTVKTDNHGEIKVRIFDCGGQPEQYQMHRLFWASQRNAMVLVAAANKAWGWKGNRGDYFLRMIDSHFARKKSRRGEADRDPPPPILAVVTWGDNQPHQTTPEMIEQEAGGHGLKLSVVKPAIDGVRQTGLQAVRDGIKAILEDLPGLGNVLPATFGKVREAIQNAFGTFEKPNDQRQSMTLETYRRFCEEAGEPDHGQQDIHLGILHALGDVLYEPDESSLKNKVINPHWAHKAIYRVLTDDRVSTQQGIMREDDWERLGGDTWPQLLMDLMKSRHILFKVPARDIDPATGEGEKAWLVPDLLWEVDKRHEWCASEPTLTKEYGRFLSEAVFLRFVGEHRASIHSLRGEAFRDQAMFTSPSGAKALVCPDYESESHAIRFYADPSDTTGESRKWCGTLWSRLTKQDAPEPAPRHRHLAGVAAEEVTLDARATRGPSQTAASTAENEQYVMRRETDGWWIRFEDESGYVANRVGLSRLYEILRREKEKSIFGWELTDAPAPDDRPTRCREQRNEEVFQHAISFRDECYRKLAEATEANDEFLANETRRTLRVIQDQIDDLSDEPRGKSRQKSKAGTEGAAARKSIDEAIDLLEKGRFPKLACHLRLAIQWDIGYISVFYRPPKNERAPVWICE